MINIEEYSIKQLLQLHDTVMDELKNKEIIKTDNNPVGDLAEYIVAKALTLKLENNSKAGYDAKCKDGQRYQIKARRTDKGSAQLSALRKLSKHEFDYLVFVIFSKDYSIRKAMVLTYEEVNALKPRYSKHVKAHLLSIKLNNTYNGEDIAEKLSTEMDAI